MEILLVEPNETNLLTHITGWEEYKKYIGKWIINWWNSSGSGPLIELQQMSIVLLIVTTSDFK